MTTKVTDLFPRLRRPLRLVAHPVDDSHAYTACAIREALDLEALKSAYRTAYSEAKRAAEARLGSQASRYRERT